MSDTKTPGQLAYEEDCGRRPTYHDGGIRHTWAELSGPIRAGWERNPTPNFPSTTPDSPHVAAPHMVSENGTD